MSTKYKAANVDSAYFITITTVNWVDLFTRQNHKDLIIESLKHCQKEKGLEIYAYVLMPSHLHLMCRAINENQLSDIIRDFKKYTAKALIKQIKEEPESRREWLLELFSKACANLSREQKYKVWQDGYHAKELFSNDFIYEKLNYIHQNPVQDGIVMKAEEYLYSSSRNYADMDGLLDVVVISPEVKTY
jgi:REP element-mobilizing transposase RayT